MRSQRRAPCCSRASMTSAGTCRSRTRSWRAWRRAAKARSSSRRAATSSTSSSTTPIRGPRSTARRTSLKTKHPQHQRSGGPPGHLAAGRQGFDREAHLRPLPVRDRELRQQPGAFVSKTDQVRVQRRQGQRGPREGRLEEGLRRHPREGRQKLKFVYQSLDQPAAPEDPGDRQAGRPEGRHRHRAEVGDGVRVLLVRRRQPGHLPGSARPADVLRDAFRARGGPEVFMVQCIPVRGRQRRTSGRCSNITRWQNKAYDVDFQGRPVEVGLPSSAPPCSSRPTTW